MQSLVINRRKLRQLRMDLGWTQKDLERQSGVRRSTISKIETGERLNLRTTTLQGLARALGVPADELLIRPHTPVLSEEQAEYARVQRLIVRALETLTDDELESVRDYIEFVRSRRKNPEAPEP